MKTKLLSLAFLIGIQVLSLVQSCEKSGESACDQELDAMECDMCTPTCPGMCPMPVPLPTVTPPGMMSLVMAAMAAAISAPMQAAAFSGAFKKLKKQKMMESKMVKKAYKKGKMMLMARMMSGQMPVPSDFMNSRNEYSYFEFPQLPGALDIPSLFPRPGDMDFADYVRLFKAINKKDRGMMW